MKQYLLLFRDQAFSASMQLFKRLAPSSFLGFFIFGVVSIAIVMPLMMMSIGYGPFGYVDFQRNLQEISMEMQQNSGDSEAIIEAYKGLFGNFNWFYLVLTAIIGIVLYGWGFNFFYKISDNEIRLGDRNLMRALKQSFNGNILRIIGFMLFIYLIFIASIVIYSLILGLLMSISKFLGILIGFIGLFFLLVFMLRFTLGIAAIVHGGKSILEAVSYSLSSINWKRGWMLFLLGIIALIISGILSFLLMKIVLIGNGDPLSFTYLLLSNLISLVINAVIYSYLISATSSLYFRYSDDVIEDENSLSEHIIENTD